MSKKSFKIEQELLNFLNLDDINNCQRLIKNVIYISTKYDNNSSSKSDTNEKSVYLLKVFLELYENLLSKNYDTNSEINIDLILEMITSKLLPKSDCDLSNYAEQGLLKTISCICRICFLDGAENNLLALAKFYVLNMKYISINHDSENCDAKYLNFRLDVLCIINFEIFNKLPNENVNKLINFIKEKKINNDVEEHKLFSNLILLGNKEVLKKTLLFVIPKFVEYSDEILFAVWQNIIIVLKSENNEIQLLRILLIMCNLLGISFYQDPNESKNIKLMKLIFENRYYWKMIQIGLSKKSLKRPAIYLFKSTIEILLKTKENIICMEYGDSGSLEPLFVWWDSNSKNEISYLYKKIIIILEYLDEQQVHIIIPMFSIIEEVAAKIIEKLNNEINFDVSWIWLIYEQILHHESTQVVKWGFNSFLKLPDIAYFDIKTCKTNVVLLVNSLNNINLYYNEGINITKTLVQYFIKVLKKKSSNTFFSFLILNICNITWSPEALFFLVHALAQIPAQKIWQDKEINEINMFIRKSFKTQNKIIRLGIEHALLKTIKLFTDTNKTTLKNVIMLLSSFLTLDGSLKRGNSIWNDYTFWIKNEYATEEIKAYLQDFNNEKMLNDEANEKYLALMLMLYADAYKKEKKTLSTECNSLDFFFASIFRQKLMYFKNVDKRPYCDKVLLNKILNLVCIILEESSCHLKGNDCFLLRAIFDFYTDILFYIQMEMMQNDKFQNFEVISLYIRAFDNLLRSGSHYCKSKSNIAVDKIGNNISKELVIFKKSPNSAPFLKLYCCMQFLKIIIINDFYNSEVFDTEAIYFYLVDSANNSLPKNNEFSKKFDVDLSKFWGKVNTEFLECKWKILEYFISNAELSQKINEPLNYKTCLNLCLESFHVAGYKVLLPVMSILKYLLPKCEKSEAKEVIDFSWKLILETKKTDCFKKLTKGFIEMLFQDKLLTKKEYSDIHLMYIDQIFSVSNLGVINTFMKHIQGLEIKKNINMLFCEILSKALIFGPILRKGERLTFEVCTITESHNLCPASHWETSNEIRGRALEMMTSLDKSNPEQLKFAQDIIDKLLETDNILNVKQTRYFGDSLTHRIKHRIMQALLIIEPIVKSSRITAKSLSDWLYNALLFQSPQPSVKYQQQWLLIRILIENSELLSEFWNHLNNAVFIGSKTKGVCSLIIISYHLYKLLPVDRKSWWINEAASFLLPFCMDQQFEIRLHSQVIFKKIYESAEKLHLDIILEKFKGIHDSILKSFVRGNNNGLKNVEKMEEDFYLNIFHPLNDYSLQTIFTDLPRLSNIGSDEWISLQIFKRCGFGRNGSKLCPYDSSSALKNVQRAKWSIDDFYFSNEIPEKNIKSNYQKKMIPIKGTGQELLDNTDFYSCLQNRETAKDGLIVVATLIDRIPNLGGLARTCEIFGAFEYILGSLKYLEDKQFASLSVTAEKWVTIKEVKKQNLIEYLINMKKNGYAIIGAEQALYSESLNTFKFPKKSLLLLGNEKEGISPNLIPLLDVCVEIPQVGIIRSLNVHVTGALFAWEYAKQNNFSENL